MGGKSRETTSEVKLPPALQKGASEALGGAFRSASIPYAPNLGPTVAAFTPRQLGAQQNANAFADAFGLHTPQGTGMAQPEFDVGGMKAYGTGRQYQANIDASMTEDDEYLREAVLNSYANAAGNIASYAGFDTPRRELFSERADQYAGAPSSPTGGEGGTGLPSLDLAALASGRHGAISRIGPNGTIITEDGYEYTPNDYSQRFTSR